MELPFAPRRCTNEPAVALAEKLIVMAPTRLTKSRGRSTRVLSGLRSGRGGKPRLGAGNQR